MEAPYNELANYLYNLSGLLVQHAQQPINSDTIQQANQYTEALTAIYPLILGKLRAYNTPMTQFPNVNVPNPIVPVAAVNVPKPATPGVNVMQPTTPIVNITRPIVPGFVNVTRPTTGVNVTIPTPIVNTARPTTPGVNVPTIGVAGRATQQVPVVNIGDVGTHYMVGWASPFRVTNVSKNGKQVDILYRRGGSQKIFWKNNKSFPAGWYSADTKPWDVERQRKWGRIDTYSFGVEEQYDTTD